MAAPHFGKGCRCKLKYILYRTYSHLGWPGSCFLDIFTAFNIFLLTSVLREAQCDAGAQFLHHRLYRQDCFFFFAFDIRVLDLLQCSAPLNITLTFPVHSLHLCFQIHLGFLASSPVGCIDHSDEDEQRSLLAAQHQADNRAGFDFSWSEKPLIYHPPQ